MIELETLHTLKARVEAATGFSPTLDRAISAVDPRYVAMRGDEVPRYCSSLDDAINLAERVFSSIPLSEPHGPWEWRVHGPNRNDAGMCRAALMWPTTLAGAHVRQVGPAYGRNPALALLSALLMALIANHTTKAGT